MSQRVVVVDDDVENCRALSELLANEGFDALPYVDAKAAWAAMASERVRPAAVVADVRMPGLGGVPLLQRIKASFPAVPVILVSAFADEIAWSEGLRAGAVDVFPKPIHGAALVRTLRDVIGGSPAQGHPCGQAPNSLEGPSPTMDP